MKNVIIRNSELLIATELEIEIVNCFANDMRTKEVAEKAIINIRTMESKVGRIKDKYGVKTVHGLVYLFAKNNLIE